MSDVFEYGFAEHAQTLWCIRKEGASSTLCGREIGFFPVVQPADPKPVCRACLLVLTGVPQAPRLGLCQLCNGRVPVVDGRVQPHVSQWSAGSCLGANLPPKRRRR